MVGYIVIVRLSVNSDKIFLFKPYLRAVNFIGVNIVIGIYVKFFDRRKIYYRRNTCFFRLRKIKPRECASPIACVFINNSVLKRIIENHILSLGYYGGTVAQFIRVFCRLPYRCFLFKVCRVFLLYSFDKTCPC